MPERPLLTFDMDGVLCRPPFGFNPGSNMAKSREAQGKRGLLWATEGWRYHVRRPMPGAVEGFRQLAERYECAVVTARGLPAESLTRRWFERYFGVVPALHTRPHWDETSAQYKARKMQELQPIAHFEDDPFTASWVSELVPAVFLVDWPRNRALAAANIHRISRLADALPILAHAGNGRPPASPAQ
jgi:hypothetical protein